MTPLMMLLLCLVMLATSFLSGIFGMAGGMILIGVLLVLLPVQTAMVLHAVTQIASCGWRACSGASTCAGARSAPMCSDACWRSAPGRSSAMCRARR